MTFATERQFELEVDFTKRRVYDYVLGRFWQVDPLADVAPQEGLSPYHYSFNNPILYNDPFGEVGNNPVSGKGEGIARSVESKVNELMEPVSEFLKSTGTKFSGSLKPLYKLTPEKTQVILFLLDLFAKPLLNDEEFMDDFLDRPESSELIPPETDDTDIEPEPTPNPEPVPSPEPAPNPEPSPEPKPEPEPLPSPTPDDDSLALIENRDDRDGEGLSLLERYILLVMIYFI